MSSFFGSFSRKAEGQADDGFGEWTAPSGDGGILLGQLLLKEKIITLSQLQKALEIQGVKGGKLGRIIIEQGYAPEERVLKAISSHYNVPLSSLSEDIESLVKRKGTGDRRRLAGIRIPIKVKLSIAFTFMIWLTILILSFVILARQKEQLYLETVKTGKVSLSYFVNNARIPLLSDDILKLNVLIKDASSVEGLLYAVIVGRDQIIKAHTDHTQIGAPFSSLGKEESRSTEADVTYFQYSLPSGSHVLNLSRPVTFKNKELGTVHVGISLDFIRNQIRKESLSIVFLSLLIVLLGIAVSVLLGFSFSRPISELVHATREIGKGNFNYRIGMPRKDELGDLARAFNYMSGELWKKLVMQRSFGRYVSPEVLEIILANPEESWLKGTRNEATVLFTDVRGFTAYAETKEPEEVVEALNEYFRIVTEVILEHGGYIDKFIGDAVLGVFCIPITRPDHAERAVRAAVGIQRALRQATAGGDGFLSRIGIGINSGVLVSGNLGSQVKMEYTVIGDSVNVASRIVGIAGPGDIMISKSTYQLIQDLARVRPLPPERMKGKAEPVEIFQVLDLKERGADA